MNREELADALVPIAASLVCAVRDEGPDEVAAALAQVPEGRFDALAVVLAAMVDPERTTNELLGWTEAGPVQSLGEVPRINWGGGRPKAPREHGTERGYQQHRHRHEMPACGPCRAAHSEHTRATTRQKVSA